MTTHKGQDLPWLSSRVLDDDISSAGEVGDVVHDERATASGSAIREERIQYVLDYTIFLWEEFWWVVLNIFGLANELG